jgi:elongation factor Ts
MGITVSEINALRQQTGAGMMDCKKALTEANGNMDEAIDFLRKKGQKVAELRAGRESNEGVALAYTSADKTTGVIISLSCETDFVAKNEDFVNFAKSIAEIALTVNSLDELKSSNLGELTIEEKVTEQIGKIGEKLELKNFKKLTGGMVVPYIHANNKIAVLVQLNKLGNGTFESAGKDVAMQVAAMNPLALDKEGIDKETVEREVSVAKEQALAEGKPENIVEKIAIGRLNKFYKENTLLNQAFVKNDKLTIEKMLKEVDGELSISAFERVSLT